MAWTGLEWTAVEHPDIIDITWLRREIHGIILATVEVAYRSDGRIRSRKDVNRLRRGVDAAIHIGTGNCVRDRSNR